MDRNSNTGQKVCTHSDGISVTESEYGRASTEGAMRLLRELLVRGALNRGGLIWAHGALDRHTSDGRQWDPCPLLELTRLEVDDELAAEFGIAPSDIPGHEPAPNTAEGLDGRGW